MGDGQGFFRKDMDAPGQAFQHHGAELMERRIQDRDIGPLLVQGFAPIRIEERRLGGPGQGLKDRSHILVAAGRYGSDRSDDPFQALTSRPQAIHGQTPMARAPEDGDFQLLAFLRSVTGGVTGGVIGGEHLGQEAIHLGHVTGRILDLGAFRQQGLIHQ